jgi:serine/threonine protein kinase/tetratricopeptide (TPR) repeat protein
LTDTVVQLTASLADRYRIERELGRGGMATVYLAQDLKHDRSVALKVLHPEIAAGLGPERFLREIRITARLQHPHILPVFDSGSAVGRLWYTMPHVKGQSLRELLRHEVQLSLETALDITCQVGLALDYAHREGAVHRDIKPENVLLSEGQALVADFGLARAVGAAGGEQLTKTGLAVGTPAYMSPEQASGSQVDARTDVYALGCVLYEMLAGEAPFTGPTPQAIIAKRFAQQPPSLRVLRPTLPAHVDEAIQKALATVPADRFVSAAEFVRAVRESPAPPVTAAETPLPPRRPRWPRAGRWGMLVLAALGALGAAYMILSALGMNRSSTLLSTGVLKPRERLLIAEFQSRTPDSMLGSAVTEAFRIDLTRSPVVAVVPSVHVAEVLKRMRQPATTRLDPALAREVAVREGIRAVVNGEIAMVGGGYLLSAQLLSPGSGEVLVGLRESADDSTKIILAIDRLSNRLRERIGESLKSLRSEPPLEQVTTNSLEALWKYTQGVRAADIEGDYVKAIPLLEAAVALDTGFATAYRTLGGVLGGLGQREREVEALTKAIQHRDRLTNLEREQTQAHYHMMVTNELDKVVTAYRAILEDYPDDSIALNNLAGVYLLLHQPALAEPLLRRLITPDSLPIWSPNPYMHLATAQVALGRRPEAELTLERAARMFPGNQTVAWFSIWLPGSGGDYRTAEARARAYRREHGKTLLDRIFNSRELAAIALARGRLAEADQHQREAMAASAEDRRPATLVEDAVSLGFTDIWFRRKPARGIQTVESALARYPLDSMKLLERPYLMLAFAYASAGRPQHARALLSEYERVVNPALRRIDESMRRWVWGQVAMAEGRFADAIARFQSYATGSRDCLPCGLAALAQAYDHSGRVDSAIAVYERYVTTPSMFRLDEDRQFTNDATQLAPSHKRLGELYEQRGDKEKARSHYSRFVEQWKDSDPELRSTVLEVRERLRRLGGESSETR